MCQLTSGEPSCLGSTYHWQFYCSVQVYQVTTGSTGAGIGYVEKHRLFLVKRFAEYLDTDQVIGLDHRFLERYITQAVKTGLKIRIILTYFFIWIASGKCCNGDQK